MKLEQMKTEEAYMTSEHMIGFVKIEDLGDAQQVKVSTNLLAKVVRLLASLEKTGFEEIIITVEKDQPIVFGGKNIGIAIAPRVD